MESKTPARLSGFESDNGMRERFEDVHVVSLPGLRALLVMDGYEHLLEDAASAR